MRRASTIFAGAIASATLAFAGTADAQMLLRGVGSPPGGGGGGGSITVTHLADASQAGGVGLTLTLTTTSDVPIGSLMLVDISVDQNQTAPTVIDGTANVYTCKPMIVASGVPLSQLCFSHTTADLPSGSVIQATYQNNTAGQTISIAYASGATTFDTSLTASGTTTSGVPVTWSSGATPSTTPELAIGLFIANNLSGGTITAPSGYTSLATAIFGSSSAGYSWGWAQVSTAATYPATVNISSRNWAGGVYLFH